MLTYFVRICIWQEFQSLQRERDSLQVRVEALESDKMKLERYIEEHLTVCPLPGLNSRAICLASTLPDFDTIEKDWAELMHSQNSEDK